MSPMRAVPSESHMARTNAEAPCGRPCFCTPADMTAFRSGGQAWRLVMAPMRPDFLSSCTARLRRTGASSREGGCHRTRHESEPSAPKRLPQGLPGTMLRPSDSPADSSGGMSSGQTRLLRCRCAGVSQRQIKTLHLRGHRPVACARSAKRPGRLEAFVRRDLHEFPCNGYFGLLDDSS